MAFAKRIIICVTIMFLCAACYSIQEPYIGERGATALVEAAPTPLPVEVKPGLLEHYARVYRVAYNDTADILPDSSTRPLTALDLRPLTPYQLEWAWREIAARRGKGFTAHDFDDRGWFEENPKFKPNVFTDVESDNIALIRAALRDNNAHVTSPQKGALKGDVDGDGNEDTVTFTCVTAADEATLTVNKRDYAITLARMDGTAYLVDMDEDDGLMEIAVPHTAAGGIRLTELFGLDGQGLYTIGTLPGDFTTIRFLGKGQADAHAQGGLLTRWYYRQPYVMKERALYQTPTPVRAMNLPCTLKRAVTVKASLSGGDAVTFPKGTAIVLLAADADGNIAMMDLDTREVGYFHVSEATYIDDVGARYDEYIDGLVLLK